ncbi:MAG: PTS sugar transporter subunit IIC [Solobacterium sp.]|nr:PTS sugar transporter subunit IIC [Solobacterium sp.]
MQITLMQGILIMLVVFICAFDKPTEAFMWFRPLVVAFFTGLCLGDVRLGLSAGAVTELSYLGLLTVGGTAPPDPLFAGLMTTVLAYTTGQDVSAAMGLAIPFALIGQWIHIAANTLFAGFLPAVDKAARRGDEKAIGRILFTSQFIYAGAFALAAFLSVYALQDGIAAFVNSFPERLIHGFEVAGGLMPAVGLALLLKVMLKGENVPYLLIGFVLMIITNCQNILPIAILAGAAAWIIYTGDVRRKAEAAVSKKAEEDYSDGI